ncbi:hypothetical protein DL765_006168 [Monosporascus sp. GIB2]|nr:hypothetical protein DL765_006168 [Monosporascus sp. GIB2]
MDFGKLTTALVAGTNENTLALANLNLDVSMVKVQVPTEYRGLDAALTSKRREVAEEGSAHRTARRLGILFQDVLPATPELIRIYGRRATEICSKIPSSQEPTIKNGIFSSFVGADVTSVWAAATSGAASISVYLLACLLARLWTGPEATSIWVEIVEERRRIVNLQAQEGVYNISVELRLVAQQPISRRDLAQWDSSARAWLQVADNAQLRRQKQLMLILNNIHLPINTGDNTYNRVMDAWITALQFMEKLLNGQPQRASKGAPLMGLACWHLYPDLLVLGDKSSLVAFNDDIIKGCAQLTVGVERTDADRGHGIYWSLALSHLRFYGDPVIANTNTTRDVARLAIEDFSLISLGATLSHWGSLAYDVCLGATFFVLLGHHIEDEIQTNVRLRWLRLLYTASRRLLASSGDDRKTCLAVVALGRRSGRSFLAESSYYPPMLLGMSENYIQSRIYRSHLYAAGSDERISYLRFIASKLGFSPSECIIRVSDRHNGRLYSSYCADQRCTTYESAVPHSFCAFAGMQASHVRWLDLETELGETSLQACECHKLGRNCRSRQCRCMNRGIHCTPACHKSVVTQSNDSPGWFMSAQSGDTAQEDDKVPSDPAQNEQALSCANMPSGTVQYVIKNLFEQIALEEQSEGMFKISASSSRIGGLGRPIEDIRIPNIGIGHAYRQSHINFSTNTVLLMNYPACECFQRSSSEPTTPFYSPAFFTLLAGDPDGYGLFVKIRDNDRQLRRQLVHKCKVAASEPNKSVESIIQQLQDDSMDSEVLRSYVLSLSTGAAEFPTFNKDLMPRKCQFRPFIKSMNALVLASEIFGSMPGTTCSLGILERPLRLAKWVPRGNDFWKQPDWKLLRPERFACIAYFESGSYDLSPAIMKDVIALSARNSIYVSTTLLGDPHEEAIKDGIACVVGNVGKTGMVMMVAPLDPKIRPKEIKKWIKIAHEPFAGNAEDCFTSTSLHLSFTEFEMPFDLGKRGSIDNDVHFVETIVSVYDKSEWVADLDVLLLFEPLLSGYQRIRRFNTTAHQQHCSHTSTCWQELPCRLTSIDNWEELLNAPEDLGQGHIAIVRANGNRLARLAAASVAVQMGLRTVILPRNDFCWSCCCLRAWAWKDSAPEKLPKTTESERVMFGKSAAPANRAPDNHFGTENAFDLEYADINIEEAWNSKDSNVGLVWRPECSDAEEQSSQGVSRGKTKSELRDFNPVDSEDDFDSDSTLGSIHWFKEAKDGYGAAPQILIY